MYSPDILEEELKNKVAADWFGDYDTTQIVGRIDFSVAYGQPAEPLLIHDTQYLLWAEAKRGIRKDIRASLVQLVLTVGQAKTYDRHLPPMFLGAFDAEKIAFLPYNTMLDTFYATDFNWNVTPSDHGTREFRQLYDAIDGILQSNTYTFDFDADGKELRKFIRQNFRTIGGNVSRIRITKNNFIAIYQKWRTTVMPHVSVDWERLKQVGILDSHFFLADILSTNDNASIKDKLFVILAGDHYILDRKRNDEGLLSSLRADFSDGGKAHSDFWRKYQRPPREEYRNYIVERADLLVPQDVRECKGEYFTPQRWVELSQEYLAAELGENWQDEYTVWDCCAGTGNLLAGLANKYNVWASTLRQSDVDIMHDRINNGANLLKDHVFQFDFLNDPLLDDPEHGVRSKLPQPLQEIIRDPEQRRRLVIYINPPYAEAGNVRQRTGTGGNKPGTAISHATYAMYKPLIREAASELFAQFFIKIYEEIPNCTLAEFSTLKILQACNFAKFRSVFRARLSRLFLVPANTFDNVRGEFPIGFFIWRTDIDEPFRSIEADVYDKTGVHLCSKTICSTDNANKPIGRWLMDYNDTHGTCLGHLNSGRNDFQNQNLVYIANYISSEKSHAAIFRFTKFNMAIGCVFFAVRHCIPADWLNDRDQFLTPCDDWKQDYAFQSDCLVYTLFHGQNRISAAGGMNHWIPFTEQEVDAGEKFRSHFMTDYMSGHIQSDAGLQPCEQQMQISFPDMPDSHAAPVSVAEAYVPAEHLSDEARAVLETGRELWRYYHCQSDANPDASFYDIRLYFQGTKTTAGGKTQMNPDSTDERYTALIAELRRRLRQLAGRIEPKVYQYGFLKK